MMPVILSFDQPCLLPHFPPPSSVRKNQNGQNRGVFVNLHSRGRTESSLGGVGELWGSQRSSLGRLFLLRAHLSPECASGLLYEASHTSERQHGHSLESRVAV